MLVLLASSVIVLAAAIFLFFFGDDILWFFKSLKYMKQGIKVCYSPIIGFMKFTESPGAKDGMEQWRKIFKNNKDPSKSEALILSNGAGSFPVLFISDQKLLKDYFKIDGVATCPYNLEKLPFDKSFLFNAGKKALEDRAIFAEIFYASNVRKLTPALHGIVKRNIAAIKKRVQEVKTGEAEFDIRADLQNIFREMTTFVLFGGDVPKIEGLSIIDQIERVVVGFFVYNMTNLPHKLTGGLYTRLGFSAYYNQLEGIHKKIGDLIRNTINTRKNSKEYKRGLNVIDLLIAHNEKMEAEGQTRRVLGLDEIVSNIILMIFAGVDTSKNLTSNCASELANYPKIQSELRSSIKSQIFEKEGGSEDYDAYIESEILDNFFTEVLRLYTPSWSNFLRVAIKDFKIGKYKISKGTAIRISFLTLQSRPEDWKDPTKFDLMKYDDKASMKEHKKSTLIPFSAGRRSCIGKNLAELSVKMIIANLANEFELASSTEENRYVRQLLYSVQHCKFRLNLLE